MNKPNKLSVNFYNLAKRCLERRATALLVVDSSYDEQIAFHRLHDELLKRSSDKDSYWMNQYYPFLKVHGKWAVSVTRMYNYLKHAQLALSSFEDFYMQAVFDTVQVAKKYAEKYTELDKRLEPTHFTSWEDYQSQLAALYELHMLEQKNIFDAVAGGSYPQPVTRG